MAVSKSRSSFGLATLSLSAALLLSSLSSSAAADLFADAPAARLADVKTAGLTQMAKRQKLVILDKSTLATALLGQSRLRDKADAITIPLFGKDRLAVTKSSQEEGLEGSVIWNGQGSTDADDAVLVIDNGTVTGAVMANGKSYRIDPVGANGLHLLVEIDPSKLKKDRHIHIKGGSPAPSTKQIPIGPQSITLLAFYSKAAKTILGNPVAAIQRDVAITNTSLANSGVLARIKLVAVRASTRFNDVGDPLMAMQAGTVPFAAQIHRMRNLKKADLVTFYVGSQNYCGIAYAVEQPQWSGAKEYGYSAINSNCSGGIVLAHELGHNMGLLHDRYVHPKSSASKYNYGFVSLAGAFRDIMSYGNLCAAHNKNCETIWYYSTPWRRYKGRPIGIPQGRAGAADGTRAINENRIAISNFR